MEVTRRNPERTQWMSGWGVINRGLQSICDSVDNRKAPVHLFMSPPNSFTPVDPSKYNVGITMGERHDLTSYAFDFVGLCNQMDLLLVPSKWQHQVFRQNKITPPIEVVPLGHDHGTWNQPVRDGKSIKSLIVDRGRDHTGGSNELQKYFEEVNYMDCTTPKLRGSGDEKKKKLMAGRWPLAAMSQAYAEADVFLKWSREGWGFPILEAMSSGCLVITNCVHLPYVDSKKNCLTFQNIPELQAMLRHASEKPLTGIKKAGQQTAAALTWDKARKVIRAVIDKYAKTK